MHLRIFVPDAHGLDLAVGKAVRRSGDGTELSGFGTDDVIPQFQLETVVFGDVGIY